MYPSLTPPRQVKIGDAAAFAGITPRAIRHYHEIGLLPEPERGGDGRRRYGYDDMSRLLWIRKMADAGISLDDMRAAFGEAGGEALDQAPDIESVLSRLEESLAAQEAAIKRRRAAVQRLQAVGSPLGLLSELVTDRLSHLPPGALRPAIWTPCWSRNGSSGRWAPPSRPARSSCWPPTPTCGPRRTVLRRPRPPSTTASIPTTRASKSSPYSDALTRWP